VDIRITGAEEFAVLARHLKEAADKDLRKELYAGMNRAVKPLRSDVKEATADFMPGNYGPVLAGSLRIRTSRRGGANPAVRLIGRAGRRRIDALDRGMLRHPLYGNRKFWFGQSVPPGFWTKTLERDAPRVRVELVEAIRNVAAKISAGI
jgi:hypothetical protein